MDNDLTYCDPGHTAQWLSRAKLVRTPRLMSFHTHGLVFEQHVYRSVRVATEHFLYIDLETPWSISRAIRLYAGPQRPDTTCACLEGALGSFLTPVLFRVQKTLPDGNKPRLVVMGSIAL